LIKVVFVNRYFHPDFSATSQMLGDLAFALVREGFDVSVVTSRQMYDQARAKLAVEETIDGVKVHRVYSTRFGRSGTLGRLFDYLSFHAAAALKLRALLSADHVVVAKTDPPLLGVTVGVVARSRGARTINWLQDLFPEVLGAVTTRHKVAQALVAVLTRLRNRSLAAAHENVAIGNRMARHVMDQGVSSKSLRIIENWCDGKVVSPRSRESNALRDEWRLAQQMVVGYSGNLGVAHEFDTILDAATLLRERRDIAFLFIGAGSRLAWLKQQVEQRGLSNVQFQPYQSRERLAESLSVPDVHLVCLRADMEGLIVPSKFYGVLAAGRACIFIGDPEGEIAVQLQNLGCGAAVRPHDAAELARQLNELAGNPDRLVALGTRARVMFEEKFDRGVAVRKWAQLLHSMQ
jgi:glycosyltransferase involved in cell wall biosynthesis